MRPDGGIRHDETRDGGGHIARISAELRPLHHALGALPFKPLRDAIELLALHENLALFDCRPASQRLPQLLGKLLKLHLIGIDSPHARHGLSAATLLRFRDDDLAQKALVYRRRFHLRRTRFRRFSLGEGGLERGECSKGVGALF